MSVASKCDKRNLFKRQKGKCCYCRVRMVKPQKARPRDWERDIVATMEHRWPKAKSGDNRRQNLALSCVWCNNAKGDTLEVDFLVSEAFARIKAIRWPDRQEAA